MDYVFVARTQGRRHEFLNGGVQNSELASEASEKKIFVPPNSYKLGVHDTYNAQLCCKS